MDSGKQARFHQLCFRYRCGHAKNGLPGKKDSAFGQCPNIAGEMEGPKVFEYCGADMTEQWHHPQVRYLLIRKMNILEEIERLF